MATKPDAPPAPEQHRNRTEEAILSAARAELIEGGFRDATVELIARRAYVSRTSFYFYFPNKRAVMDRLIRQVFAEMYEAAGPYVEGDGDPRADLHAALAGVVVVVDREADVLRLALDLAGAEDQLPSEWQPYIHLFVRSATERIERDQRRGLAPDDIGAAISARALCAMVERHVAVELILGEGDAHASVAALAELWYRAAYSGAS